MRLPDSGWFFYQSRLAAVGKNSEWRRAFKPKTKVSMRPGT